MSRALFALITLSLAPSGCTVTPPAQYVWIKADASQQEFAIDRYACLQQSQQREANAYVDETGGVAHDRVITNGGLFGACMNARGWYLQRAQVPQPLSSRPTDDGHLPAGCTDRDRRAGNC